MKDTVLYLDIDGVLDAGVDTPKMYKLFPNSYISKSNQRFNTSSPLDHLHFLNIRRLHRLNNLVKKLKISKIVICSSWSHLGSDALQYLFFCKGFPDIAKLITGITTLDYSDNKYPIIKGNKESADKRYYQILKHVSENKIENWMILDDMLVGYENNLKDVHNYKYGLTKIIGIEGWYNKCNTTVSKFLKACNQTKNVKKSPNK